MAKKTTSRAKAKPAARKKTTHSVKRASSADAEANKGMAIIAYLGILFIIPLLTGDYKKSPFLKFHTNQGFVLFLTAIALWIVWSIIWAIFIRGIYYSYAWGMWTLLSTLSWLLWLAILAFCVIGIINAVNGKMKPLPLIGKFVILK